MSSEKFDALVTRKDLDLFMDRLFENRRELSLLACEDMIMISLRNYFEQYAEATFFCKYPTPEYDLGPDDATEESVRVLHGQKFGEYFLRNWDFERRFTLDLFYFLGVPTGPLVGISATQKSRGMDAVLKSKCLGLRGLRKRQSQELYKQKDDVIQTQLSWFLPQENFTCGDLVSIVPKGFFEGLRGKVIEDIKENVMWCICWDAEKFGLPENLMASSPNWNEAKEEWWADPKQSSLLQKVHKSYEGALTLFKDNGFQNFL